MLGLDIDIAMLAMNPTQYGNYAKVALPAAQEKCGRDCDEGSALAGWCKAYG